MTMRKVSATHLFDSTADVGKFTSQIFSVLENKFLFGCHNLNSELPPLQLDTIKSGKRITGKVRILSIDGGGFSCGICAGRALAHLESCLRRKSGNPNARISDYFDVVAGAGSGGILAALLFTHDKDGLPIFSADEALAFLLKNRQKISPSSAAGNLVRRFRTARLKKLLRRTFGEYTLKDALKSILIPCYDLSTRSPFVFSRADAVEMDGYDFKMKDVCLATSADPMVVGAVGMMSVDSRTKIVAVDGGLAMNNPTAAAITHVLNNKQEFPFCNGLDDLLVVSLGNGNSNCGAEKLDLSPAEFIRIAGEGASDVVDQAVSMAFGQSRSTNYVRIQTNGGGIGSQEKTLSAEEMMEEKNVESVLFRRKRVVALTNSEKLESFAAELIKEQERREFSIFPAVVLLKQVSPSSRTSSATTSSSTLSF